MFRIYIIIGLLLSCVHGCSTMMEIILIPFEKEVELGKALMQATKLVVPTSSIKSTYGVVDRNGKFLVPMGPEWISHYREGLSATAKCDTQGRNCRYGFRDKDLNWVISPNIEHMPGDFSEGFAVVPRDNRILGNSYYIDKSGKRVFTGHTFYSIRDFKFGYARVALRKSEKKDSKGFDTFHWGWLDKNGKVYDFNEPPLSDTPWSDHPGNTWIREEMVPCPKKLEDGRLLWGFRNLKGDWLIPPKYYSVHPFYFGKAFVQTEIGINIVVSDQFHLIDKKGKEVYPGSVFQRVTSPNHRGIGTVSYVPEPGTTASKTYLYNWKTGKKSDFQASSASFKPVLWEDKWFPATRWIKNNEGNTIGHTDFYDENFQKIDLILNQDYKIHSAESFSGDAAFVRFSKISDKKMKKILGFIDRSGKVLFYLDDGIINHDGIFMDSGRIVINIIK